MTHHHDQNAYDIPKDLQLATSDIVAMGGLQCFVKLDTADFAEQTRDSGKLDSASLDLNIFVGSTDLLVEGKVKGELTVPCSRCLKECKSRFSEDFSETVASSAPIIDIMSMVRQTMALTSEMKYLCSPECKGLCPVCGADKNVKDCGCQKKDTRPSPFSVLKEKLGRKTKE